MKDEAQEWSISALSKELGPDRRTIKTRIAGVAPCRKTKLGNLYKMRDVAVPVLIPGLDLSLADTGPPLNLEQERARLAHFQALERELVVKRLEGSLIPLEDAERIISGIISTARSQLLGLGSRLAQSLVAAAKGGPGSVQTAVDVAVEDILNAMASNDLEGLIDLGGGTDTGGSGDSPVEAAGPPENKRVGRKKPVVKPRKCSRVSGGRDG